MSSEREEFSNPPQAKRDTLSSFDLEDAVRIDQELIHSILEHGGDLEFLQHLLLLFQEHSQQSLQELHQFHGLDDLKGLDRILHRWRGSCLNIGALSLAERLRKIEELDERTPLIVSKMLSQVERHFQQTSRSLGDIVQRLLADSQLL